MLNYNDLYEILRKEKYSETLQALPKKFIIEFAEYVSDKSEATSSGSDLFADSVARSKKQLENAIALFKELILRRKKKLLNLVFVATETGIMKRDYENMLPVEKEVFDKIVKAFEDGDKEIANMLNGHKEKKDSNRMILIKETIDEFMDMSGKSVGPYKAGDLINIDNEVAMILVSGGKAAFMDEE